MFKLLLPVLLVLTGLTQSCSKKSTAHGGELVGKWKQTEYLIDPGNGSGTWQPYQGEPTFLTFKADGTVEYNRPVFTMQDYDRYSIIEVGKMWLLSSSGDSAQHSYSIENNRLTIGLRCIEPCGARFERVNK